MARNFFWIFTENNPIMGYSKTFFIPEAKGLNKFHHMKLIGFVLIILLYMYQYCV